MSDLIPDPDLAETAFDADAWEAPTSLDEEEHDADSSFDELDVEEDRARER
ncbi:hypothetical protein GCM10025760_15230 [Microbacterium yannicii]|uniref:Uncharacterized protein n=1 Tax=Microbacterium yannicii TaxID=671622 RepID=A0ABP9M5E7_9MICO|nr:hypothetical protein [Microbacterium yannicii]MCO5954957.1 hypothetical protein [Microbacterium yannicii]